MNGLKDKKKREEFLEKLRNEDSPRDVFTITQAGLVVFLADIANILEEIRDEFKEKRDE